MPAVRMSELQRAARGGSVTVGSPTTDVPPHILGMTTSVRAAVRRVHEDSPAAGSTYITNSLAHYLARAGSSNPGHRGTATAAQHYVEAVEQCGAWHASSGLETSIWQLRGYVPLSETDGVDALVRVVLEDPSTSTITGRVILWDSLAVTSDSAELMAASAVTVLDQHYTSETVAGVEIWQCFGKQKQAFVPAPTARAAVPALARFVARM